MENKTNRMTKDDLIEILFLIRNKNIVIGEHVAGYWKYQFSREPKEIIEKLISKNYLRLSEIKENFQYFTIAELKPILKEHSLKVSGAKAELVKRVVDNIEELKLKKYITEERYIPSELGIKIIEDNKELEGYYHSQDILENMGISKYYKKISSGMTATEITLEILEKQAVKHLKNKDYGLLRNTYGRLSKNFTSDENINESLKNLLKLFHIDLSGMCNGNSYSKYDSDINGHYFNELEILLERKYEEIDFDELKIFYFNSISEFKFKKQRFTDEESFNYLKKALIEGLGDVNDEIELEFDEEEYTNEKEEYFDVDEKEKLEEYKKEILTRYEEKNPVNSKNNGIDYEKRREINKKIFKWFFYALISIPFIVGILIALDV